MFKRSDLSGLSVLGHGQNFDWEILLSIFLIIVVSIAAYNTYVFLGVRAGDIFQVDKQPVTTPTLIDQITLKTVIDNFDARAKNYKDLETKHPVLVDPSM